MISPLKAFASSILIFVFPTAVGPINTISLPFSVNRLTLPFHQIGIITFEPLLHTRWKNVNSWIFPPTLMITYLWKIAVKHLFIMTILNGTIHKKSFNRNYFMVIDTVLSYFPLFYYSLFKSP